MSATPFHGLMDELFPAQPTRKKPVAELGNSGFYYYDVKKGGMAEVFICSHKDQIDRPRFALKSFRKEFFFYPDCRTAFNREAALWAQLSGLPHIMPLLSIQDIDERPFIVMPAFVKDKKITLRDHIGSRIPVSFIHRVLFEVAYGLKVASEAFDQLTHGDLKPENIIVSAETFITDFGLSHAAELSEQYQHLGHLKSTYAYRAPELWDHHTRSTAASDIYSIGIILYEMLTGSLPFKGTDEKDWAKKHRKTPVPRSGNLKRDKLATALFKVCTICLEKDPAKRPASFHDLFTLVVDTGMHDDTYSTFHYITQAVERSKAYAEIQKQLKPEIIQSLLRIEEYEAALNEFRLLDEPSFDAELWLNYGTVLSLNNLEEEAIKAYKKALSLAKDDDQTFRHRIMSEYALSLKRLGHFKEALKLYDDLLMKVPRSMLSMIVVNMASVYVEMHDYKKGIQLLENSIGEFQENSLAWKALATCYYRTDDTKNAIRCFTRCIDLDPTDAQSQAHLGYSYFIAGDAERAESAFFHSMQQGYMTHQLFIHELCSEMLLNKESNVKELLRILYRDTDQQSAAKVIKQADELLNWFVDVHKYGKTVTYPFSESQPQEPPSLPEENDDEEKQERHSSADQSTGLKMPFINTRYYMSESMYSIDFYYPPDKEDYADHFLEAYNTITRNMQYQYGHGTTFRNTPLYFTQCPQCALEILTNRDEQQNIRCAGCQTSFPATIVENKYLNAVLIQVNAVIDRTVVGEAKQLNILLVQEDDRKKLEGIKEYCISKGYAVIDNKLPIVHLVHQEAYKRGLFNLTSPVIALSIDTVNKNFYEGMTVPQIEKTIRELRKKFQSLKTASSSLNTTDLSDQELFFLGRFADLEQILKQRTLEPANEHVMDLALLVNALKAQNKTDEAKSIFNHAFTSQNIPLLDRDSAIFVYHIKASLERHTRNLDKAITYLEQIYKLDPTNKQALLNLAEIYHEKRNEKLSREYYAKYKALGGDL